MPPTDTTTFLPARKTFDIPTVLFLAAATVFLYPFLFTPPLIPISMRGDCFFYVVDGMRMCDGKVMYRDFFQFSTPGTGLVYFLLFMALGIRAWIPNVVFLLLGLGLALVGIAISKRVVHSNLAYLPSAIFLVGMYKNDLDPTHHWFSLLATMIAILILMDGRSPNRAAAAGFFVGLAACFTQSRGLAAFVGLAIFLWWESRRIREAQGTVLRNVAWLSAGFLAAVVPSSAYFVWKAGLARYFWCTVVFGMKYWPLAKDDNSFRVFTDALPGRLQLLTGAPWLLAPWVFVFILIPFIHVLFFVYYWRTSDSHPTEYWRRPMLLGIVGLFILLSIAPAPYHKRIESSALPALILLGWFIESPRLVARTISAVLAGGLLFIAPHAAMTPAARAKYILPAFRGKIAVPDRQLYEEYRWTREHLCPGQYIQLGLSHLGPDIFFYLGLRNPSHLPVVTASGYTTVEQGLEVVRDLTQHQVRYVFWNPDLDPDTLSVSPDDHLGPVRSFLRTQYHVIKTFANSDEIWESRDAGVEPRKNK